MIQIPDAPWIRETEATGYCSYGWWNTPPDFDDLDPDLDALEAETAEDAEDCEVIFI